MCWCLCVCVWVGVWVGGWVDGFMCVYELRMASTDKMLRFINTLIIVTTNYYSPPWEIRILSPGKANYNRVAHPDIISYR